MGVGGVGEVGGSGGGGGGEAYGRVSGGGTGRRGGVIAVIVLDAD